MAWEFPNKNGDLKPSHKLNQIKNEPFELLANFFSRFCVSTKEKK